MSAYNILEARNNLSRIVASVESGAEEAVIMRRGRPVAKIVPVTGDEPARHTGASIVAWLEANPLPPGVGRTPEQIDADIREMREAGA